MSGQSEMDREVQANLRCVIAPTHMHIECNLSIPVPLVVALTSVADIALYLLPGHKQHPSPVHLPHISRPRKLDDKCHKAKKGS